MEIVRLAIPDVRLLRPRCLRDARGWFAEIFDARVLEEAGVRAVFVQDSLSRSEREGTVRGLHFQAPPRAQTKLVRVQQGRIFDVAVDLRRGSPTFGQWVGAELGAEGLEQLLIPRGFAHGFCTLEPGTVVAYRMDDYYAPEREGGIFWRDPTIGIDWPDEADPATISPRDAGLPTLDICGSPFAWTA
jgi:dTDP-4-dehydrorhamnose 3,5-epimerase